MKECSFVGKDGLRTQVSIGVHHYAEAQKQKLSLRQLINRTMPTVADAKFDTFTQLCCPAGLNFTGNKELGFRPTTMHEVVYGTGAGGLDYSTAAQSLETSPVQSRVLFPAAIIELVENKLQMDRGSAVAAYNQMVALTTTVAGARVEQPVISYERKNGPEAKRNQARAQLAEPATMMTITASEKGLTIPETPLSVVISDQALQGTTVDMVALALQRQGEVESYARAGEDLLDILQGDLDAGDYGTSALAQVKADTFDSSLSGAALSHKAYLAWLYTDLNKRRISHVVTDWAGAFAIENRTGKPTNVMDNSKDRIDSNFTIFYPNLVDQVQVYVVDSAMSWPANTIMGIDAQYGIHKFVNAYASYSDVERFVLRRGSAFVVSFGTKSVRMFDQAFSVLSLVDS